MVLVYNLILLVAGTGIPGSEILEEGEWYEKEIRGVFELKKIRFCDWKSFEKNRPFMTIWYMIRI